jgi:hypothetical protein
MSDFFQNGVIATFHRLGELNLKKLEKEFFPDKTYRLSFALSLSRI